ncbi:3'-5' exoribonuclease YhaM family protein [Eremococcus coleocola]|uniref:HD domain protein n=1 Tax=Eremococcus coleocola ACS-139-V-Col8 TaxID=908337 RepID=E4KQ81_9LACT|nr:HD domain-containing protein [Eremococcus coleocola]EFR30872.1 HD domain protein [Eremococcus coleocola ACS-139-V-Col8]
MTQLYDLHDGENFGLFVLIKAADKRVARNGNPFIAFRFQDKSGSMDGMYWSATDREIQAFQAGKVVYLKGRRDTYNGTPQVKIEAIRLAELGEPNDPTLYVESIGIRKEAIQTDIENSLLLIKDGEIARVVRRILKDHQDAFYSYPAAKRLHHAVAGGLSFHTMTMLKIAQSLLELYPQLNASLLIGGIVLHDIGKTIELSGPISTEYTLKGQLMGHIVLIDELIDRAARDLNIDPDQSEAIILLKHMVLAHHGKQEYGSPVVPRLLEAEIIHYIDDMDAKINMISSALEQTERGAFSQQIFALDRREVYRPNFD